MNYARVAVSEGLMPEREEEVEKVLLEIRQRLIAERGAGDEGGRERAELARIEACLGVASRARDRLPPVASDRRGWRARLEVWTKLRLRRATNWFTWEQINFNTAVVAALRSAHALLAAQREREAELLEHLDALERELHALKHGAVGAEGARVEVAHARDAGKQ
ncbi:MAG: hypothetical protein LC785_11890 [Acidobacteria bacterium]|nr:hypothetical protein [Acidobacteriota bacterium]